ncbi:MAG: hypothetical protein GXZ08_08575 [Tissierellia bacterium]|nr:hypothetical protein [Tissierellia bacterium]
MKNNITKLILSLFVFLFLIPLQDVYADNSIPEMVEGQFVYDLADKVSGGNAKHINKLSSELLTQANTNLYVFTVTEINDTGNYLENLVEEWGLNEGRNVVLLLDVKKENVSINVYKSKDINWIDTTSLASGAITYGSPEFNRNSFKNGVRFSYNSIFKSLATYYKVSIDGVNIEQLPTHTNIREWSFIGFVFLLMIAFIMVTNKKKKRR